MAELGTPATAGNLLVIGIGNLNRGDDAVGRIVVQQLIGRSPAGVRIVEHDGESSRLLDCLGSAGSAYVVDACTAGASPGTITRIDVSTNALPLAAFACSTHGLGLAHAIELARALGRLPRHCVVYAIEGHSYEIGAVLSPQVAVAAINVADLIWNELHQQNPDIKPSPSCPRSQPNLRRLRGLAGAGIQEIDP